MFPCKAQDGREQIWEMYPASTSHTSTNPYQPQTTPTRHLAHTLQRASWRVAFPLPITLPAHHCSQTPRGLCYRTSVRRFSHCAQRFEFRFCLTELGPSAPFPKLSSAWLSHLAAFQEIHTPATTTSRSVNLTANLKFKILFLVATQFAWKVW